MNANQQVQYRKMMEYLSPFDMLKINNPEYQELKRRTSRAQQKQIDQDANDFILKQLGTPLSLRKRNSSYKILPPSMINKQVKQLQSASKNHGRSSSVLSINQTQQLHTIPKLQLLKSNKNSIISEGTSTILQNNHSVQTPTSTSRNRNNLHQTPSNFSKSSIPTQENQHILTIEDTSPIKGKSNKNHQNSAVQIHTTNLPNMNSDVSNLNLSSIIDSVNMSKSALPNQIVSKSVVYQEHVKYVWSEIKFKGKLCEGRSFSQAVVYNNSFYFYGGYDSSKGVFKDFVSLTFSDSGPSQFQTVQVSPENKETPGRLCRHGAILRGNSMIIFGGKTSSLQSSNCMFEYLFNERLFNRLVPHLVSNLSNHSLMPSIDSHSMIYNEKDDQLIISCGFLGDICEYSNDIYTYSFSTNLWTLIKPSAESTSSPSFRGSHGSVLQGNKLFIFGGTDGENILEDMWYFDMNIHIWNKIDYSNQNIQPGPRSGIQMLEFEGYFIIFGGFKSLINERNDLTLFDSRKLEWVYQSERKEIVEIMQTQSMPTSPSRRILSSSKKLYSQQLLINQQRYDSPINGDIYSQLSPQRSRLNVLSPVHQKRVFIPLQQKYEINELILVNRESKFKANNEKKMHLLKQFEVPEELRRQLLSPIPILQSMKSSLHLLSTCNKQHQFDQINQTQIKSQDFQNTESKIKGKHPGARDGYLCAIIGEKLIIFGGDRHRMSLNDTYELDLRIMLNYLKKI